MRLEGFGCFLCKTYTVIKTVFTDLLAGSTLIGSIAKVALWTVLDTLLVTFTFTDEVEGNLHFLCESQGLYLNGLRLALFWTALRCHTDAKHDL